MVVAVPTRERPRPPGVHPARGRGELPGHAVKGIEVFQAGKHRDDAPDYAEDDLQEMVDNYRLLRGKVDPPVVVGHEEDQPLTNGLPPAMRAAEADPRLNTGSPALGWVTNLWRVGKRLFADVGGLPLWLKKLLDARRYAKVSAEVYDPDSPAKPPGAEGYVFRRLALLGGEMPQIKDLPALAAEDSEVPPAPGGTPRPRGGDGACHCCGLRRYAERSFPDGTREVFFEVHPMDRTELEGQLTALGYSDEQMAALKDLPDDVFAAFVLATLAREAGTAGAAPPPPPEGEGGGGPPPAVMAEFPEGMDRQSLIEWLTAQGEDPAALDAMTDDDLIDLYNQRQAAPEQMSEPGLPDEDEEEEWEDVTVPATPTPPPAPAPPARRPAVKSVTKTIKFSEEDRRAVRQEVRTLVAAETAAFRKEATAVREAERKRAAEEKRGRVRAFCERLLKENKITPAELDESNPALPSLVERLMLCDAQATVRKFSEGGKEVALTQLDVEMRALEARPPRKYNEKLPGGKQEAVPAERKQQLLGMTALGRQILAARANGKN
jgi:hypothetical protein